MVTAVFYSLDLKLNGLSSKTLSCGNVYLHEMNVAVFAW